VVPFVIYSQPTGVFDSRNPSVTKASAEAHRRYAEILKDVEQMIDDHSTLGIAFEKLRRRCPHLRHHANLDRHVTVAHQNEENPLPSKLKLLVPTAGPFFTRLPLEAAFKYQDMKRYISSRRYVSPSFNDVRLILNSAQIMAVTSGSLQLATFDGDVTLYEDGQSLEPSSPVVPRLLDLLRKNVKVGIVTAAGYTTADRYYDRLHGLLDAIATSPDLSPRQRSNLVIMGGEANYLFEFSQESPHLLSPVSRDRWLTAEMKTWGANEIKALLDVAEAALRDCVKTMSLPATMIRKDHAVGIIPRDPSIRLPRESLEETVLVVQKILELSALGNSAGVGAPGRRRGVPFCAFNGGRDVFVDIGDKSWGVAVCQEWFGGREGGVIRGENTLHVGDQFLSAGSNDFKARSVCTTAWIANPAETVDLLDELSELISKKLS